MSQPRASDETGLGAESEGSARASRGRWRRNKRRCALRRRGLSPWPRKPGHHSPREGLDFARMRTRVLPTRRERPRSKNAAGPPEKGARADPSRSAGPQRRPYAVARPALRGSARTRRRLAAPPTEGGEMSSVEVSSESAAGAPPVKAGRVQARGRGLAGLGCRPGEGVLHRPRLEARRRHRAR